MSTTEPKGDSQVSGSPAKPASPEPVFVHLLNEKENEIVLYALDYTATYLNGSGNRSACITRRIRALRKTEGKIQANTKRVKSRV